ncbi:MAG: hypothetical protein ACYC4H_00795 [Desulfocucumaceae bacterium]
MALRPPQFKIPPRPKNPPTFDFPDGYAGGMNTSLSPDLIALNESPDLSDVNFDAGGVPTKRLGYGKFNASDWGAYPIRGMYEFWKIGAATPIFLVAWNGQIWSVADDGTKTSIMSSPATVADAVTGFFPMNDICYIYTGTEFLQYTGTGTVTVPVGYAPTITKGRAPTGGGTAYEALNYLSNSWVDSFSGTATDTVYTVSFTNLTSVDEVRVSGVLKTVTTDYTVNLTTGVITFTVAPGAGTDKVTIKCTKAGLMDPTINRKSTIFQVYGGKTDTRVFAAGHPTLTNNRYQSGLTDPTYWPEDGFTAVTSDAEDITGFGRVIDYQIIGKSRSYHYSYIEGPSATGVITFPVLPLNDEYGCLAGRTMAPVKGGLLALSVDNEGNPAGVAWITPSTVRAQMNVSIISENINKATAPLYGLLDNTLADLQAAHAIVHDKKYYLFVKDKTWILDLKYSDFANGRFCWYPYTTAFGKAGCFISRYNGDLCIGDKSTGLIYKPAAEQTATTYQDDGVAYNAYWMPPLLFGGRRDWEKKFDRLKITFAGQPDGNHVLTIITDQGNEEVNLIYQATTAFDYSYLYYDAWTYGVNFYPYPQAEKIGYKSVYLTYKISNNQPGEGMTILAQSLTYTYTKEVR